MSIAGLLRRGGLSIRNVHAVAAGTVHMDAVMTVGRKRVVVLRGRRGFARAGSGTLGLKLTRAGRRLLARGFSARLTLRARFTTGGHTTTRAPGLRVTLYR
jgi:hypothetical protein